MEGSTATNWKKGTLVFDALPPYLRQILLQSCEKKLLSAVDAGKLSSYLLFQMEKLRKDPAEFITILGRFLDPPLLCLVVTKHVIERIENFRSGNGKVEQTTESDNLTRPSSSLIFVGRRPGPTLHMKADITKYGIHEIPGVMKDTSSGELVPTPPTVKWARSSLYVLYRNNDLVMVDKFKRRLQSLFGASFIDKVLNEKNSVRFAKMEADCRKATTEKLPERKDLLGDGSDEATRLHLFVHSLTWSQVPGITESVAKDGLSPVTISWARSQLTAVVEHKMSPKFLLIRLRSMFGDGQMNRILMCDFVETLKKAMAKHRIENVPLLDEILSLDGSHPNLTISKGSQAWIDRERASALMRNKPVAIDADATVLPVVRISLTGSAKKTDVKPNDKVHANKQQSTTARRDGPPPVRIKSLLASDALLPPRIPPSQRLPPPLRGSATKTTSKPQCVTVSSTPRPPPTPTKDPFELTAKEIPGTVEEKRTGEIQARPQTLHWAQGVIYTFQQNGDSEKVEAFKERLVKLFGPTILIRVFTDPFNKRLALLNKEPGELASTEQEDGEIIDRPLSPVEALKLCKMVQELKWDYVTEKTGQKEGSELQDRTINWVRYQLNAFVAYNLNPTAFLIQIRAMFGDKWMKRILQKEFMANVMKAMEKQNMKDLIFSSMIAEIWKPEAEVAAVKAVKTPVQPDAAVKTPALPPSVSQSAFTHTEVDIDMTSRRPRQQKTVATTAGSIRRRALLQAPQGPALSTAVSRTLLPSPPPVVLPPLRQPLLRQEGCSQPLQPSANCGGDVGKLVTLLEKLLSNFRSTQSAAGSSSRLEELLKKLISSLHSTSSEANQQINIAQLMSLLENLLPGAGTNLAPQLPVTTKEGQLCEMDEAASATYRRYLSLKEQADSEARPKAPTVLAQQRTLLPTPPPAMPSLDSSAAEKPASIVCDENLQKLRELVAGVQTLTQERGMIDSSRNNYEQAERILRDDDQGGDESSALAAFRKHVMVGAPSTVDVSRCPLGRNENISDHVAMNTFSHEVQGLKRSSLFPNQDAPYKRHRMTPTADATASMSSSRSDVGSLGTPLDDLLAGFRSAAHQSSSTSSFVEPHPHGIRDVGRIEMLVNRLTNTTSFVGHQQQSTFSSVTTQVMTTTDPSGISEMSSYSSGRNYNNLLGTYNDEAARQRLGYQLSRAPVVSQTERQQHSVYNRIPNYQHQVGQPFFGNY